MSMSRKIVILIDIENTKDEINLEKLLKITHDKFVSKRDRVFSYAYSDWAIHLRGNKRILQTV